LATALLTAALVGGVLGKAPAKEWLRTGLEARGLIPPRTPEDGSEEQGVPEEEDPAAVAELMDLAPSSTRDTCSPIDHSAAGAGAEAAIGCSQGGGLVQVRYVAFSDTACLAQTFTEYSTGVPNDGDCAAGLPAKTTWSDGEIACYINSNSQPTLLWTEGTYNVLALAVGDATTPLKSIYGWWQGRPTLG
jgi:hypothetical protein